MQEFVMIGWANKSESGLLHQCSILIQNTYAVNLVLVAAGFPDLGQSNIKVLDPRHFNQSVSLRAILSGDVCMFSPMLFLFFLLQLPHTPQTDSKRGQEWVR